jgi:hypothetical protein
VWSWRVFSWGCAGGVAAYVLAFVLPRLVEVVEDDEEDEPPPVPRRRVRAFVGLAFVYVVMAGFVAAVWGGASSHLKEAVAYGMSWEVVAKGVGTTIRGAYLRGRARG